VRRVLILCAIASATVASSAEAAASPPRATLDAFACVRAASPPDRAISVTAVMRPVSGTARMALRFELERRTPSAPAANEVSGGDLGKWLYPTDPPTLGQRPDDVWRLDKDVIDLDPGVYRFSVWFRWIAADGRELGIVVRRSPPCNER